MRALFFTGIAVSQQVKVLEEVPAEALLPHWAGWPLADSQYLSRLEVAASPCPVGTFQLSNNIKLPSTRKKSKTQQSRILNISW